MSDAYVCDWCGGVVVNDGSGLQSVRVNRNERGGYAGVDLCYDCTPEWLMDTLDVHQETWEADDE